MLMTAMMSKGKFASRQLEEDVKAKMTLSTRQTAKALGVGLRHVLTLLYEGKLPGARKAGRKWVIPAAAIEARLKTREQTTS